MAKHRTMDPDDEKLTELQAKLVTQRVRGDKLGADLTVAAINDLLDRKPVPVDVEAANLERVTVVTRNIGKGSNGRT